MSALFAGGHVLDWIIAGVICEGVALSFWRRLTGGGITPQALLPNLFAGLCLMVAMRLALSGFWWGFVSAALLGALIGHLVDLKLRWRQPGH